MADWSKIGKGLVAGGMALCVASVLVRLMGHAYIFKMETLSFFNAGLCLMVVACVAKLYWVKKD